jgi:hypothetical protein
MSELVDALTRNLVATTANGAVTQETSLSKCVDLFFLAGASRRMSESDIIQAFCEARAENKQLAWRIVLWARDCRGGAGEKRFFRVIGKFARHNFNDEWEHIAIAVPEVGSWKDLFLIEEPNKNNLNFLAIQLKENKNKGLLAKYFPRKGRWFTAMHKYLGWTPKQFRKFLVSETKVVEHLICKNQIGLINYSAVPSVAMNRYKNLFDRKDGSRFNTYIQDVLEGKSKINSSVLFPNDIISPLMTYHHWQVPSIEKVNAIQAQWDALPDYMSDSTDRILPVCDVSGSMWGLPMEVSVALGLYISERNRGIFEDAVMTFSSKPEMHRIYGNTIQDRVNSLSNASWGMSTDLQKTFQVILDTAVENAIPENEMPNKLLIISDMEFDQCGSNTNLEGIRNQYEAAGYTLPEIVFWNVNGRPNNVPARINDEGIGLVSGFSPAILKTILAGQVVNPVQLMRDAVDIERYSNITRDM